MIVFEIKQTSQDSSFLGRKVLGADVETMLLK